MIVIHEDFKFFLREARNNGEITDRVVAAAWKLWQNIIQYNKTLDSPYVPSYSTTSEGRVAFNWFLGWGSVTAEADPSGTAWWTWFPYEGHPETTVLANAQVHRIYMNKTQEH